MMLRPPALRKLMLLSAISSAIAIFILLVQAANWVYENAPISTIWVLAIAGFIGAIACASAIDWRKIRARQAIEESGPSQQDKGPSGDQGTPPGPPEQARTTTQG